VKNLAVGNYVFWCYTKVTEAPPATISGHCVTRNMEAVSLFRACAVNKSFPHCWNLQKNIYKHYERNVIDRN
jgi:hypothetical protein